MWWRHNSNCLLFLQFRKCWETKGQFFFCSYSLISDTDTEAMWDVTLLVFHTCTDYTVQYICNINYIMTACVCKGLRYSLTWWVYYHYTAALNGQMWPITWCTDYKFLKMIFFILHRNVSIWILAKFSTWYCVCYM